MQAAENTTADIQFSTDVNLTAMDIGHFESEFINITLPRQARTIYLFTAFVDNACVGITEIDTCFISRNGSEQSLQVEGILFEDTIELQIKIYSESRMMYSIWEHILCTCFFS